MSKIRFIGKNDMPFAILIAQKKWCLNPRHGIDEPAIIFPSRFKMWFLMVRERAINLKKRI
jgi:hypothetical protein